MEDDIRRPRPETNTTAEEQNKHQPNIETPHLYGQEAGFAATQASTKRKRFNLKTATKKQKIILAVVGVVVLFGGGGGVYALLSKSPTPQPAAAIQKTAPKPAKTTEPSKLTGVEVKPELNKRPVTSIQIENSPDARPQSGLKDAGVIYEAIAEGGITRFNVNFQETQPDYIGPVRSVRPYYAALAAPFDPIFVHAGGSGQGLAKIQELGFKDLDHGANAGAFQRVSDRAAPHNLYTSTASLDKVAQDRGYTSSDVKGFKRKAEKPGQPVTARAIDMAISSALYNIHYDYDVASNSYKRSMGGAPHTDQKSNEQLSPKVVIGLVMDYSHSGIYSVYNYNGAGKAYIFQDGIVTEATWNKASDKDQFSFTDATGKEIGLNAGQTWLSLVKAPETVSYTP